VKAKGHKENSPKENENIRQGWQGRYTCIDRTRSKRAHPLCEYLQILTWTAQLLCRLGYGLKDSGLWLDWGQGEQIRHLSEMSRPNQPPI